jgi:hypothetical protein
MSYRSLVRKILCWKKIVKQEVKAPFACLGNLCEKRDAVVLNNFKTKKEERKKKTI